MIRVLLAEDKELIREALRSLLSQESDIQVVASVADGKLALDAARRHRPDIAILDLEMPRMDGTVTVAELGLSMPSCRAVILTGHGNPLTLRRALASGAWGYLAKGAPGTALADAVRRVHEGSRYVDPLFAADALTAPPSPLTAREAEILAAAQDDRPIRDVARKMFLSPGTVRNALSSATHKLGAATRREAFNVARDSGWV